MSSPTGFRGFADLMGLQGEEIERLKAKALEPSQFRAQYAQERLGQASREARATGQGDITKTGSYSQFIDAQRQAQQERAQAVKAYNANADSKLESSRGLADTSNMLAGDLQNRAQMAGGVAKQYASQMEQQRARNTAYNSRYAAQKKQEDDARMASDSKVAGERDYQREIERMRRAGMVPYAGQNRTPGFVAGVDDASVDPYNALELQSQKTDENERRNEEYRRQQQNSRG